MSTPSLGPPALGVKGACYLDSLRLAHCVPRGEHIVFMGDSLTRYQYLALAQSLRDGVELGEAQFPSLVKEREWDGWMAFFAGTNERLGPNHRCDCYREYARPVGSKSIENHYFWHGGVNLTFINVLDKAAPLMGHWAPWAPLFEESERTTPKSSFSPRWRLSWEATLLSFVKSLQPPPTVLILNTGLWGAISNESFAIRLSRASHSASPRVLWKSTTRMRNGGPTKWRRTDLLARRVFSEVYDAAYFTRACAPADFWDPRHFLPHVYNRLNKALLWQLYGRPSGCIAFNRGRCSSLVDVSVVAAGGAASHSPRTALVRATPVPPCRNTPLLIR